LNSPSPFRRLALSPFRFIRWTVGTGLVQRMRARKRPWIKASSSISATRWTVGTTMRGRDIVIDPLSRWPSGWTTAGDWKTP